jgi:hypothetical protein
MTLFEYLAIAFGLLYSVAALRLLGGLAYASVPERRYWLHTAWTVLLLLGIAASFWTFWSLRDIAWTFPRFLLALALPGFMYYSAAALIPENAEAVTSWREHYYAVHRRFFTGFGLWGLAAGIGASVNLGMTLAHPARAIQATAVTLGIIGAASASERIHKGIVTVMLTMFVAWAITAGVMPGWMSR